MNNTIFKTNEDIAMKFVFPEERYLPNVKKIFELLADYEQLPLEADIYTTFSKRKQEIKNQRFVARDYAAIAHKCFANHRLNAAAIIIDILCQELKMDSVFAYKGISIILENDSTRSEDDFFYFIRHAKQMQHLNAWEVALEYLMHILQKNDFEHLFNLKSLISGLRDGLPKNNLTYPLLKAYMGMFDYLDWKKNCQETSAQAFAERSISTFKDALKVPGQWDIFVLKLVEMLQYYERYEEIESALTDYVEGNPEHLNAYIYLCTYLNEHAACSERLVKYLKILARMSPSDIRVLWLIPLIKDTYSNEAFRLIFMFLDYPCNADNSDAWELLLKLAMPKTELCNDISKAPLNYWGSRCSVWPYVHFDLRKMKLSDKQSIELVFVKAKVLHLFEPDHPYIKHLFENLPEVSMKRYKKLEKYIQETEFFKKHSEGLMTSDTD